MTDSSIQSEGQSAETSGAPAGTPRRWRQSRLGCLAALLAFVSLAAGITRLVISEMRLEDAFNPGPHVLRETLAEWATYASLSLSPAAVVLAMLTIWLRKSRAGLGAARVGLAVGFWVAFPLWSYELLLWLGWIN
jgi:hypothetical protein